MLSPTYYPLPHHFEGLEYSPVFYEDTMTIYSSYTVNRNQTSGNLFDMFTMVPSGLWIGYFVSFITFVAISYIGHRLLNILIALEHNLRIP